MGAVVGHERLRTKSFQIAFCQSSPNCSFSHTDIFHFKQKRTNFISRTKTIFQHVTDNKAIMLNASISTWLTRIRPACIITYLILRCTECTQRQLKPLPQQHQMDRVEFLPIISERWKVKLNNIYTRYPITVDVKMGTHRQQCEIPTIFQKAGDRKFEKRIRLQLRSTKV